jgi:hypothetical protein
MRTTHDVGMSEARLQVVPAPRTEVEVAADTVAAILATGLIRTSAENIARMAKAAGVTPLEVRDAWRRHQDGKARPPMRVDAGIHVERDKSPAELREEHRPVRSLPSPEQLARARAGGQASGRRRFAEKNPEPGMRLCSDCGPSEGPKPVGEFRTKGTNTQGAPVLDYLCRTCRRRYFCERYARVGQQIVQLEVLDGDECVGGHCPGCGNPIPVGDMVVAGGLRHELCPA